MKTIKVIAALLVLVFLLGLSLPALAAGELIPLREAAVRLGGKVSWDPSIRGAIIEKGLDRLVIFPDSDKAVVAGETIDLSEEVRLIDGQIYLPLDLLAALLSGTAYYDPETGSIYIWTRPEEKASYGTVKDLAFELVQDGRELVLSVKNPLEKPVRVDFPTSQRWDVVLYNSRGRVWRASDEQSYLQVLGKETWEAGEVKTFKVTLPEDLKPGKYYAEAYFVGLKTPVSGTMVEIKKAASDFDASGLKVDVRVQESWFGGEQRLVITARNTTSEDIKLPGGMDIVFKQGTREVWRLSRDADYGHLLGRGTIEAGATRTDFQKLPDIEPGFYKVEIYYGAGKSPAASSYVNIK